MSKKACSFIYGQEEIIMGENRQRPIQKKVRLNHAENDYIRNKIEKSPFDNFQNFARTLLITGEVRVVDFSELETLNHEVRRIGNNMNQLIKLAHKFDEISNQDILDLQQTMAELTELVSSRLLEELRQEQTM